MISDGNVCRLSDECIYSDIVIFTLGDNVYTVALNSAYSNVYTVALNSAYSDDRLWSIHHSKRLSANTLVFFHILIWCGGYQIYNIIQ